MKVKIYGEAKSGTTYLEHLLRKNTDCEVLGGSDWDEGGWKHGFPQKGEYRAVFLVRNVYEWARSMMGDTKDKRFGGLQAKFGSEKYDFWHRWANPLECRKAKYFAYIGFLRVHGGVIINFDHLRGDPKAVIYEIKPFDMFSDIEGHVYLDVEGRDNPKRPELTDEDKAFIDKNTDKSLERYINGITIERY